MWKIQNGIDLQFTIADTRFDALNFVYEEFRRSIPRHVHGSGSYEIHYISRGYGQALIQGRPYEITPNTLFVTGPHIEHAQTPCPDRPMCEYCIYLKAEKKRRRRSFGEEECALLETLEQTPFWFGQDTQRTGALILELFEELKEMKTGWQFLAEALLRQLPVRLARNYEYAGKNHTKSTASVSQNDKTSVLIEEYFLYQYHSLSLEELARLLHLGTRQTERLLQRQYGKSFLQKKTEARMSAASILLSDPGRSITSVSEALGYSSVEHFSAAFRKYYRMSPRQYRKEMTGHGL